MNAVNDMRLDNQVAHHPHDSVLRSELPSVVVAAAAVMLILVVNAGSLGRPDAHPVPSTERIGQIRAHETVLRQDLPASSPPAAVKAAGI